MIMFFLLNIYIDNAIRLPVGVRTNGLAGITTLFDEGLAVFQNAALIGDTKFNFTLSRWLYGTNIINFGAAYKKNALGIHYLNYGVIQGYDEYGIPTNRFAPYDLNLGLARCFGPFGLCIKNFQSRVDSVFFTGIIGGISTYIDKRPFKIGARIDNVGKEFVHKVDVPLMLGLGAGFVLPDGFEILTEIRGIDFEWSNGILYSYENLKIFLGAKYILPKEFAERFSLSDFAFSGGLSVELEEYELGYSFVYTQYSNAHLVGIVFTPAY